MGWILILELFLGLFQVGLFFLVLAMCVNISMNNYCMFSRQSILETGEAVACRVLSSDRLSVYWFSGSLFEDQSFLVRTCDFEC